MKKFLLIFVFGFLALSFRAYSQINVDSSGDITFKEATYSGGIKAGQLTYDSYTIPAIYPNTANAAGLGSANKYFHIGYIHHLISSIYDTWPSDRRAKTNVRVMGNALKNIILLNPVRYDISDDFISNLSAEAKVEYKKYSKDRLGFIAQELQEVFPELVNEEPTTGYLGINTVDLVPVLVQAIKEQQAKIEELQTRIETIEEECCNNGLKSASISTDANVQSSSEIAILYQNNPNPFKDKTNIRCFIPQNSNESWLYIYDLNGVQLDQFKVNGEGIQSVTVPGSKFKPGMFLYSLIIDGREVDTKRMILTK